MYTKLAASSLLRKPEFWALVCITFSVDLFTVVRLPLFEQLVCHTYSTQQGRDRGAERQDDSIALPGHICKSPAVQSKVARLNGNYFYFYALSAILLSLPYAWVAARIGKKPVLVAGVVSTSCQYFFVYVFCTSWKRTTSLEHPWPDELVWLCQLSDIFGGGTTMAYTLLWSGITEATPPERRSETMFTVSSLLLATDFIAMGLGGILLQSVYSELCLLAAGAYLLNIPVWFFPHRLHTSRSKQSIPGTTTSTAEVVSARLHLDSDSTIPFNYNRSIGQSATALMTAHRGGDEEEDELETMDEDEDEIPSNSRLLRAYNISWLWWYSIKQMLISAVRQYVLQPSYLLAFTSMFLFTLGSSSDMILQQWTSRAFDWSLVQTTHLLTFNMFVSFVVFSCLLPMLSHRLHRLVGRSEQVDYYLTMTSLALRVLGALFMSISSSSYTFVPALALFTMGVGVVDSFRAFVSTWNSDQQITEMFSILTIVGYTSWMLAGVLWPWLFTLSAELDGWAIGLPYFVSTGCCLLAMSLLAGVWKLIDG